MELPQSPQRTLCCTKELMKTLRLLETQPYKVRIVSSFFVLSCYSTPMHFHVNYPITGARIVARLLFSIPPKLGTPMYKTDRKNGTKYVTNDDFYRPVELKCGTPRWMVSFATLSCCCFFSFNDIPKNGTPSFCFISQIWSDSRQLEQISAL